MTPAPAIASEDAGARNVRLLSELRWLAIGGQLATIVLVETVLGVALPLVPMLGALAVLSVLNTAVIAIERRRPIGTVALFATLLIDVACLTVQLYLAGGIGNPFVSLYLLQVVIATVLLPTWSSWTLAALTSGLFAWLARSPYRLPPGIGAEISRPYAIGAWVSYVLAAILIVLFGTRIVRNLALRDAHLAAMRQRAAEAGHVVRMGLLASGAAHELGTPLASLAVTLGDWRRDPAVRAAPDLLDDVATMAGEVARCKEILGQVLLAAGEVRGDAPVRTTLGRFVADTVAGWRRPAELRVAVADEARDERAIVADRPLAQTLVALLDNAREAGASRIAVTTTGGPERVVLTVRDDGRGFAPAMLAALGNPYNSSKPRRGAGLGLFLATNVLRTLGGTIEARNVAGGAEVLLAWPFAALAAT